MNEEIENEPVIDEETTGDVVPGTDPETPGDTPDGPQNEPVEGPEEENSTDNPDEEEPETVIKKYVQYFVQIKKDGEKEKTFKTLKTEEEDWDPFITYDIFKEDDEAPEWEDVEEIPEEAILICTVKTTGILPAESSSDDETSEDEQEPVPPLEEEEEETTLNMKYYYTYYEVEVPVDPSSEKVKGICVTCKYCITSHKMWSFRHHCHRHFVFNRYLCNHPEHQVTDYVSGAVRNGDCYQYNNCGECELYEKIPEENTEGEDIPAEEQQPLDPDVNEPVQPDVNEPIQPDNQDTNDDDIIEEP